MKSTSSKGGSLFLYRALMDVNGGNSSALAEYDKQVPQGEADYMVKPFLCNMLGKPCSTDEEFDAFVKSYMQP